MTGDLDKLTRELEQLAGEEVANTEIIRGNLPVSRKGIQQAEAEARKIKKRVEHKRAEIEKVSNEIKAEIQQREKHLREQMSLVHSAVSQAMEPIEKIMHNLNEGLTSMGLYLGRGEQIFTIRDGKRADVLEPIVLRQMVLAMDEETGIFAEDDGINADNVAEFDQWLLENQRHVEQIVPEHKCIVALVPRWRLREDETPFDRNEDDQLTHFLIRNGECLFRTSVQFEAGARLIPAPDEFVQFFRRKNFFYSDEPEGAIKPGTREYNEAMEQSDDRSRHYLRIGLILQGLIDRTEIFHPLHPAGVNFLVDPTTNRDAEKIRVILDGEGGLQSGLETFEEWRKNTNAQLRVGMQIVGAFNTSEFRHADRPNGYKNRYSVRIYPNGAEAPPAGVPLLLEKGQDGYEFKVRYPRNEEIWDNSRFETRKPKLKAWCHISATDEFILAYDLINAALMERFLSDRRSRRQYKELWPLMKAIWHAKRIEEASEAPFRQMLAGVLARDNGVTVAEAEIAIPDLVRWYKLANRYHRPLVLGEGPNGKAGMLIDPDTGTYENAKPVILITAEHKRRIKDATRGIDESVVAMLVKQHPICIAIVRPRRGGYIVLSAEDERNIYVREQEFNASGVEKEDRHWRLVGSRAERWTLVRGSERWDEWDRMADPLKNLTGPEIEAAVEYIKEQSDENLLAVTQDGWGGKFSAWVMEVVKFDPAHPLTQPIERRWGGICDAYEWSWWRKGTQGQPTFCSGEHHLWSEDEKMPWGTSRWRQGSRLLWVASDAESRLLDARVLEIDSHAFASAAEELVNIAWDNLSRQWVKHETERLKQEFLSTGHAEDWEDHLSRQDIKFPFEAHSYSWKTEEESNIRFAVGMAIEHGFGTGELLSDVWARARTIVLEEESDPDKLDIDFPDELVGLTVDFNAPLPPEPDEEDIENDLKDDESEEPDEETISGFGTKIREVITDAMAPKPEKQEPIITPGGIEILDVE